MNPLDEAMLRWGLAPFLNMQVCFFMQLYLNHVFNYC